MAKWTKEQRVLSLMDDLKWKGISNWTDVRDELAQKEFMPFQSWLRRNLSFIPSERARAAIEKYYMQHETIDNSSGFAVYLREGKSCLITAYMKDQAYGE